MFDPTGMHELSLASAVVDRVLELLDSHGAKKVLTVHLSLGEFSHVAADQLQFCYTAIAQGTAMENSTLEIEKVGAIVECPRCTYKGRPNYWEDALFAGPIPTLECPQCGGAVEPVEGNDCTIRTVRFMT
jgi:hydrogenase nickel incorporation protein HypA/HybF